MTPEQLQDVVRTAVAAVVGRGALPVDVPAEVVVERPKNPEHGDYATNVALRLAKPAGRPPREVAGLLAEELRAHPGVAGVDVAGPGFLNITLAQGALGKIAVDAVTAGEAYGRTAALAGQKLNLEFVSANPTGPVHIGGSRWAAVGDAIGRLLEASGADVTREYYINDAGAQIDRFARSLQAAANGRPVPEGGYGGTYIADIAASVVALEPDLLGRDDAEQERVFRDRGVALMLDEIRRSMQGFGVDFDVWFSEKSLYDSGAVDKALATLREQGHVYESEGAVWLRTTDFGDDKDRVLVKADGETTYFASDCAYYLDKRARGFDRVVIMLGADHSGYVGRYKALVAATGDDPAEHLQILLGQLVNLLRDGEPVRMSKRAGTIVVLEDLVDAIGVDAARYALARASVDQQIDIDVELWSRRTNDNPVFYVQYAHARISSVLRNAADLGIALGEAGAVDVAELVHDRENDLLRALGEFPRVLTTAAELRAPHRVARYLEELAGTYHRFYDACRVLPRGDEEATPLTTARLWLCAATAVVLRNGLGVLGVTAPERM
ncbi:arginine--tRNA ligase [Blastococcus sp. MG754426]|uniref:arginine--tRNA ligase n=1 Tax=unclassified Blastococcus TaxID=2619396 RepID=UPI001EF0CACA|nr:MULTISPECIES: arginine--tRNA ligase [unclassified Blastococcus]MCF6505974.1 arginine--tRNA ligase [Blastococcus sp. MG754426]MCF6510639.1 arginine--tRNA ligase [Blastococcus sp. MG754427]MCF6733956.1 arginine--tRNA ligase [Blastococcus sp. KM273129]